MFKLKSVSLRLAVVVLPLVYNKQTVPLGETKNDSYN